MCQKFILPVVIGFDEDWLVAFVFQAVGHQGDEKIPEGDHLGDDINVIGKGGQADPGMDS